MNRHIEDTKEENVGFEPYNLQVEEQEKMTSGNGDDNRRNNDDNDGKDSLFDCLKYLFIILLSPAEGWKKLKRDDISVERLEWRCFYPMMLLLALSEMVGLFFRSHLTFGSALLAGVLSIAILFFSYYIVMALGTLLPEVKGKKPLETSFGKKFVIISLTSLAFFGVVSRVLPMFGPVTVFLPIWTIYIISKGVRRLGYGERHGLTPTVLLSVFIIGVPLLMEWLLETFMPAL